MNADGQKSPVILGRNRGQVAEVVVFTTIGDGFQIFHITSGDPAALFHKAGEAFGVCICIGDLIQGILDKIMIFHFCIPMDIPTREAYKAHYLAKRCSPSVL